MQKRILAGLTALLILIAASAFGQEHSEHPKKTEHPSEHPEHPEEQAVSEMTLDMLAEAITRYIESDAKLKGGYFLVYDTVDEKTLQLELLKVHKERLATLGHGVYFACTDMEATDGTVYDLDFFMKQTDGGTETTEVAVHKKSGKPRYGWKEDNGTWKKVKN
ncbi:MAG: hypothetical protein ACE5G2_08275 [Candidatus Krumholzibacteriia bacterium]